VFLSRLTFYTLPGKTDTMEQKLMTLAHWVDQAGGTKPRVMRTHYSSAGAPDLLFEQEVADPGTLEQQIKVVTDKKEFQEWVQEVTPLLERSSKRELFKIVKKFDAR
jgi:hypothetical protein